MTLVKDRLGIYEAFRALDELFWEEASTYISSFLQWEMGAEFQAALITLIFSAPGASLVTQKVNNLSAMQETQVWALGWEDSLEKGIPTHSSIWRIPWTDQGVTKSQTQLSDRLFSPKLPRGGGHSGLPGCLPAADLSGYLEDFPAWDTSFCCSFWPKGSYGGSKRNRGLCWAQFKDLRMSRWWFLASRCGALWPGASVTPRDGLFWGGFAT